MTLNAVGAETAVSELSPDWYQDLTNQQLAAYIRYQYISQYEHEPDWDAPVHNRNKPAWDGGRDSYGVQHKGVWQKAIEAIRQAQADPGVWVSAHFSGVGYLSQEMKTHTLPDMKPSRLYSAASPQTYATYVKNLPEILARRFDVAGHTIATRVRGTAPLKLSEQEQFFYVLCDEAYVCASPFFRHAFAARLNCEKAVERYLWPAALDYEAQQRFYDQIVEPWCITEQLRAATAQIRKHWKEFT